MSQTSLRRRILQPRILYAAVAVACAALVGFGMYLQEVEHLEPCPLCILQRYAFVAVGLLALSAALLPRALGRFAAWFGIVAALSGAGVGAWHVWLQLHPPAVSACGPSLEYLVSNLPLGRALPRIFQGYGDCTAIDWSFLGLTIPGWSLLCLSTLAVFLGLAQRRA
ncbi:Disulfide bond formation protein B [Burkholderiales bacterium]|nr:Disulfide bond formation protein B [Burkholderiales bacterium]